MTPRQQKELKMSLGNMFARLTGAAELPTIDHDDFSRVVEDRSRAIVDVREEHEYLAGHIAGAVNFPLSRFAPENLPGDKPVVLVCLAGGRSAKALRQAISAGHRDICHYSAGTSGWRARGGALEA
jgi:rhodanese-related sulfurtransferase